ncbi:hypothetical protein MPSEU_000139500 [Mayamaea pseudoterrestris]|nr:hypothetical protein MPSEU_000139500 [Mayamaea pseudoterrestris]
MQDRDLRFVNGSALEQHLRAFQRRITVEQYSLAGSNSSSTITPDSLSACLLIKDDNVLLNEWIAYHYHTMRMRHLLVAIDPSSQSSPEQVFATWRNLTDLQIVTWNDTQYMPESFLKTGNFIEPNRVALDSNRSRWLRIPTCNVVDCTATRDDKVRIANHRFRQVSFLSKCLSFHRDAGRTLTMHIDTDEYVVLNRHKRKGDLRGVLPVPSLKQPDGLFNYLSSMYRDAYLYEKINLPCLSMPRVLFGSVEKDDTAKAAAIAATTPSGYNARKFETLRWWYHTTDDDKERNGQPKVIIDVSRVPADDEMYTKLFSIHRPSKALCRTLFQIKFDDVQRYPLTVSHYIGPWDRYNARNDSRRTYDLFHYKSNVHEGPDYYMRSWLRGFIDNVGVEKAKILLASYQVSTMANETRTRIKLQDLFRISDEK